MTPIRGFFKRLLNPDSSDGDQSSPKRDRRASTATVAPEPQASSGTPPDHGASDEPQVSRRRRGRRGGRGRNRSGSTTGTAQTTASTTSESSGRSGDRSSKQPDASRSSANGNGERSSSNRGRNGNGRSGNGGSGSDRNGRASGQRKQSGQSGSKNSGERREYQWGRRVPDSEARDLVEQRMQQSQRRRRTNRRVGLDAPLPEDIAFRAATEGGDRSILPSRRRRPEGLRDTERVIIAGPRSLSGWSHWGTMPSLAESTPEVTIAEPEAVAAPAVVEDDVAKSEALEVLEAPELDTPTDEVADAEAETDADTDTTHEEDASARPRRRGRRGGRGRRRPTDADAATLEGVHAEDDEDDVDDDTDAPVPEAVTDATEERRKAARQAAAEAAVAAGDFPPAFVALGIDARTLTAIARMGYQEPTPIQERAIPALLNGLDVVGVAQTGSGKTVAFGVPMMERLDASLPEVQGIVLVPTRELAQQVLDVLDDLGDPWGIEAIGLLGGRRLDADFRALKNRPHVVVGTPGRIIDHLNRGTLSLRHVRYAVLDEADQMLDIGFLPDIRRILSRTPKRRQTALFSATMPSTIRRLVWQFMDDPETVSVDPESSTVDTIEQTYVEVAQRDKVRGLRELIERELKGRTLVFSRTKRGVDHLEAQLSRDGVRVGALHGDMDQRRRDRVVQEFREGKLDILCATNVAARGLDIPEITHVVNYDVPQNIEEYVHRIGRTGRAGRTGKAITFVCEWDMDEFDTILREFGELLHKEELTLYSPQA